MNATTNHLTASTRVFRAVNSAQSHGTQRATIGAGGKEPPSPYGAQIAQTALQSIGMSTRDGWGSPMRSPDYALAVSLIFTKATNQTIILQEPPSHVCSTSILWNSLAHDKRFEQIPMSEAAPGDIIIGSGWRLGACGYTGIVVDHGRIVSNSGQRVQDNSSLLEIQRSHPELVLFRYIGFRKFYPGKPLANAGFNADEPRLPAGQQGGGQWTSGDASPAAASKPSDMTMELDPPIASDPISEALELLSLASIPSLLKSIPSLVDVSAEGLVALLRKLAAVAAGGVVKFTEEESGLLTKILSRIKKPPIQSPEIAPEEIAGKTRSDIRGLAKQKGLTPAGDTASPDYPRKWKDPITGKERLRLDRGHIESETGQPYDNPNAAADHVHAYDSNGKKIKVNGDPHIPTTGE